MIKVNGKQQDSANKTMCELLKENAYDESRIAVELNGSILPKKDYSSTVLKDGDEVEIVCFVGGG